MEVESYKKLLDYYKKELALMDCVHYNSRVTESVYKKWLPNANSCVLPITHLGIKDNRKRKTFSQECIRMMFVGNITTYKGFPLLKEVLIQLYEEKHFNWVLNVWGGDNKIDKDCALIIYRGKYTANDLNKIYEQTDLLVVPSLCPETFSLVTLEAVSYGVPTLVSENVGAKDIIAEYDNYFIYKDKVELYHKIKSLLSSTDKIDEFNKKILFSSWTHSMEQHVKNIKNLIYKPLLDI